MAFATGTASVSVRPLRQLLDTLVAGTAERVYASQFFHRLRQDCEDVFLPDENRATAETNGLAPVLRAVFLLSQQQEDQFRRTAQGLQREYQERGIQIDLRGPFPPLHFNGLPKML